MERLSRGVLLTGLFIFLGFDFAALAQNNHDGFANWVKEQSSQTLQNKITDNTKKEILASIPEESKLYVFSFSLSADGSVTDFKQNSKVPDLLNSAVKKLILEIFQPKLKLSGKSSRNLILRIEKKSNTELSLNLSQAESRKIGEQGYVQLGGLDSLNSVDQSNCGR